MTKHTLKQFVGHFVGLGLKELTMVSEKKNKKEDKEGLATYFLQRQHGYLSVAHTLI